MKKLPKLVACTAILMCGTFIGACANMATTIQSTDKIIESQKEEQVAQEETKEESQPVIINYNIDNSDNSVDNSYVDNSYNDYSTYSVTEDNDSHYENHEDSTVIETESEPEKVEEPTITGISHNRGLVGGGEQITIYGKNFSSNIEVYFGSTKSTIISKDDSVIIVKTPEHNQGKVDVIVKDLIKNLQSVLESAFEFYEEETIYPSLNGLSSVSGYTDGKETISLFGSSFGSNIEVYFGDKIATIKNNKTYHNS